ncbi:predicted protein, partial [Phaeodactylum tricornutum CCAP 1055/1]
KVLFATDEWFAAADNLLKDTDPVFDPEAFCEQGKVMDGWETRRRRESGHDWSVLKLASRGIIHAVEIDTAHFTGNNVPQISIEIADLSCTEESRMACQGVQWKTLLDKTALRPGYEPTRLHYFSVDAVEGTHIRVNYFPDGGVARIRLWGQPIDEVELPSRMPYIFPEISGQEHGGVGFSCSNKHYGDPWNLIQPTLGRDMGDGWETARHPERPAVLQRNPVTKLVDSDLMDYCVIKLGAIAGDGIARIILDTKHFRGNYPESVQVQGCCAPDDKVTENEATWFTLIPRGRMAPDAEHVYECDKGQIENVHKAVTHIKVSIYPDGGLSRVRVY